MLLRFQKAALQGNYETGNQALSMHLRFFTIRDVFAFAWRDSRIVVTHDADFLDNKRFPPNRNPRISLVRPGVDEPFPPAASAPVRRHLNQQQISNSEKLLHQRSAQLGI